MPVAKTEARIRIIKLDRMFVEEVQVSEDVNLINRRAKWAPVI